MIQVHGHRGARAGVPENLLENTIAAFEYAIGVGVDAIEMDVVVSSDDVVVVSHDPYLKSGLKPGTFIRQLTAKEAGLPTLDQVFALAGRGNFLFNIEAKVSEHTPANFAELVLDRIGEHGVKSRVIFQSFDFAILHRMNRLAPGITRAALWEGVPRSFVEIAQEAGTTIVAPEYVLVTPEEVQAAHAAGLRVIPWTANTVGDWERLIAAGVDGIITDDPAALIGYLRGSSGAAS
ncbi:MAG TPA: glycerophosphodiester phosphodiesterase family protein [Bryobacteraceae bacterium]|nr:glycerophosphodiester phosphodiesterase family protein [Bryobacteraceae bacterium]